MNMAYVLAKGGAGVRPGLPGSLKVNPRLGQWLRIAPEGVVEVFSGKVELGQGILTALAQIVAEELDVPPACIRLVPALTGRSPDEAVTSGSLSIQESGAALRHAAAEARAIYAAAAGRRLNCAAAMLRIEDGAFIGPHGARTSYWELADETLLDREATGAVQPKPAALYRVVGTAAPRLDLADKTFGAPRFIHDLTLPGMLEGRVLRPPSPGAVLEALDEAPVRALPGIVGIVRDGSFVAVLAVSRQAASRGLERLARHTAWREEETLPDEAELAAWLKAQPAETHVVDATGEAAPAAASRTVRAAYTKPFLAHASIAPSCALAWADSEGLRVWTHSQGIYNLRRDLALALGMPEASIVVQHVEGAGCYGHNGADDVAFDAARLARASGGRPVRVEWSRADELAWSPLAPAVAVELEADLGPDGAILGWRHEVWSSGHSLRPGRAPTPTLLGSWHIEPPFPKLSAVNAPLAAGGGSERNAIPGYDFPSRRIVNHRVLAMPVRTSAMRALGAFANVFAAESFMDEVAATAAADPLEFRLRHLGDPRARVVLERAAERAGWSARARREGVGHGIGFARYKHNSAYCAVVAEVEAAAEIRVRRLVVAVDVGLVVNPDGVANQVEGGAIQATSWTLKEAVRFDRMRLLSRSWADYPILRFSEVPSVEVEIVARPDCPPLGAGECSIGPTAAAIGNAVCDALGVRVRDLPITRDRIAAL